MENLINNFSLCAIMLGHFVWAPIDHRRRKMIFDRIAISNFEFRLDAWIEQRKYFDGFDCLTSATTIFQLTHQTPFIINSHFAIRRRARLDDEGNLTRPDLWWSFWQIFTPLEALSFFLSTFLSPCRRCLVMRLDVLLNCFYFLKP